MPSNLFVGRANGWKLQRRRGWEYDYFQYNTSVNKASSPCQIKEYPKCGIVRLFDSPYFCRKFIINY